MRPLLDVRLRASLINHFPSRCTIQQVVYTTTASNQKIPSGVTDVLTMTDIPCRIGPIIEVRPTDDEIKDSKVRETIERRHCKLMGYYSAIQVTEMQAVVDDIAYSIKGVEHDGERFSTRLRLEVLKP